MMFVSILTHADDNVIQVQYNYKQGDVNVPTKGIVNTPLGSDGWYSAVFQYNAADIDSIVYSSCDYDGKLHDNPVLQCIWIKGERQAFLVENVQEIKYVSPDPADPVDPTPGQDNENSVDLGLSVKWAMCNIGAKSPEESGTYYAWGETKTKFSFNLDNYSWYKDGSYTKYGSEKMNLDDEDDVAHVELGGDWRLPTAEEMKELNEKCKWTWTTMNGVNGYEVTGTNGNSIFLPDTGFMFESDIITGSMYPSSTYTKNAGYAECILFYSNLHSISGLYVEYGYTVRAVCK